ncbi:MAG: LytTR family transcriptional regulator [Flavobacterium sp.]|nr:MAG: LytTR family transcriptional regulator [Flavobacterium sp.]
MRSISIEVSNKGWFILLFLFGSILLILGKDFLHAFVANYNFYFSESLLFGLFWLLFIPFFFLNHRILKRNSSLYKILLPIVISISHIAVFALLVFSISAIFYSHTFEFWGVFSETIVDHGLSCLLIYGLVSFFFLNFTKPAKEISDNLKKIRVTDRNEVKLLAPEEILYVKTERPYIAIVTRERRFLHSSTLKDIMEELPNDSFIQIHKSTIINLHQIQSYRSRKNGDYDVLLKNDDRVRVSRNYNSFFRSFLKEPLSD